jgi:hypothetical protein
MIEAAYEGWRTDVLAAKTSLMAAATNQDVTALNIRARADRVAAGQVEADGVALRDSSQAGVGDWIVTRRNDRRMTVCSGRDFVKIGDTWTVTGRRDDGSLIAKHQGHSGRAILPADYVRAHVELAYATTTNRAQGSTVDTAHPLITEEMTRENLYVVATRAREYTMLYVATHQIPSLDPDDRLDAVRIDPVAYAAREVLENVVTREVAELSATETIRQAQNDATNLSVLIPNYQHAHQILAAQVDTTSPQIDEPFGIDLPAWLPPVPDPASLTPREHAYLQASAELICTRIEALARHAIAERPAWTCKLGDEPAHPEERTAWAARIGILAAYREQQQITDNDPHHPTGPYIESNQADYSTYLYAFRAAAELRQASRGRAWSDIDSSVPARQPSPVGPEPCPSHGDGQAQAREARWASLSPGERRRITEVAANRKTHQARSYQEPGHGHDESVYKPTMVRPPQSQHNCGATIGWKR